jgi:hypothetical protein
MYTRATSLSNLYIRNIILDDMGIPLLGTGLYRGGAKPYSPECVEGEFCEVCECDQSSLACSSVFTPQCARGLRSEGSRVFWSTVAGSNSSWVRLADERSAPERSAPERSASRRSAPVRSGSIKRSLSLHEFRVTLATLMAS